MVRACAIALAGGLTAAPLWAAEELGYALLSGFESWHADDRDDLNPHNAGIGLRFPGGYTAGYYFNSIRNDSFYLGREWRWRVLGDERVALSAGGVLGAVSGYKGGLHLLVVPELVMTTGPVETALIVVPRTTKTPVTVALQLRWRWR